MFKKLCILSVIIVLYHSENGVSSGPIDSSDAKAQIFKNLGNHHRTISTKSKLAQEYFDQGLTWMFAFNHEEAIRSFEQATELDETCAMAWWGISMAYGPNYNNFVMSEQRTTNAWNAMQKALLHINNTIPVERMLIEALKHRNPQTLVEDGSPLNISYAKAMANVWEKFPNDADVGTLYAESEMLLAPWDLYSVIDRLPRENTPHILSTLEGIIKIAPKHPGALHLYIHAIEPSQTPQKSELLRT